MKLANNIIPGLSVLLMTGAISQAQVPTLDYHIDGTNLIMTYTGTLYQSSDAVNWSVVQSASSPYQVTTGDKKLFFCVKWGETGENVIVPLAENVDMEMVWIEPGSFMMGSPEDELGREDREIQHQVTISKGFWIGKYEVTQAQYKAVTGKDIPVEMSAVYPASSINWSDAMDFCEKLTQSEQDAYRLPKGYRYTLPTAAQWEYACRAGTTTSLNSGKNITSVRDVCPNMDEVGWYYYNASGRTQPVGQKLANNWGLYDMEGNLWEWVSDWFGYYTASAVSDPVGAVFGTERTLRGGSWYNYQNMCRSAFFINYNPAAGNSDFGFRVVLTADPNAAKDLEIAFAGYSASESTVILRFTKGLDPVMAEDVLNYSITDKFAERVKVKKADYEKEKYRVTLSFDKDYDLLFGDVLDVTVSNAVTDTGDAIPEDLTATVNINKYPLKALYYDTGDINTLKTYVAEGKKADWLEEMPVVDYGQYYSWRCDYLAGWLTAPETGKYSIWFYNDYSGELWLSSDDTKEGLGDTPLIIGTYAEVRSSGLIELVAGQRYYFEIYHKSDGVPNLTILAWVRPSQNPEYIIPETLSSALPYNYGIPEPIETEYLSGIDVEPLIDMAPAILRQPLSKTVGAGTSVSLSVKADGTAPLRYQWYKNDVEISGAVDAVYAIPSAELADAGIYTVTVSNEFGSASGTGVLTVREASKLPWIISQPQGQTVDEGAMVTFTVVAKDENTDKMDVNVPLSADEDMELTWIEPGTFIMGSPEDELGRSENEIQHQVTLTQGYWIGRYPVTEAQYKAVIGSCPSNDGDNHPVHYVSWSSAADFCARLTEIERKAGRLPEGYEYALPTEAQWQYACRAGTTTALNSGKNLTSIGQCPNMDEVGWYYYNSDNKSHSVGLKRPNAWGLYDMHGSVWEWCWDYYGEFSADPVVDPMGPAVGDKHAGCGGFYGDAAYLCRTGRHYGDYDNGYVYCGFRVALVPARDRVDAASEGSSVTYQWYKNGQTIKGADGSSYTIKAVKESDAGEYTVSVCNNVGCVTSRGAVLTVNAMR